MPEFDRKVLEVLREPLESGHVVISRAARQVTFPASFQLVAAMNPCPCGYLGDAGGRCRCSMEQVSRYRGRLSGPLLDRIDLHIEVPALPPGELQKGKTGESSTVVRERVLLARERQLGRQQSLNQGLGSQALESACALDAKSHDFLEAAMIKLRLSARAFHRVLRVARTIADLDGSTTVTLPHLSEALGYRLLDRQPA